METTKVSHRETDLRNYRQFYLTFRDFEIWYARVPNLNWTHYRSLLRVQNEDARKWYMAEASKEHWSTRTLDRNINSQYYFRLLQSPKKNAVVAEMKAKIVNYDNDKLEFLKNPIVAEFLGLSQNNDFTETKLETAIIDHLQKFIMELGKGYAYAALLLALLFESLYRWLCRKVWDHFFCLQVDELTRKWVDKLMRKWVWRGSMSQYFYGFG